jgi:hypothetical protein
MMSWKASEAKDRQMMRSIAAAVILLAFAEPALALPPSIFGTMPCCMQHGPHHAARHRSYRPSAASFTNPNPSPSKAH